jgi:hypothetical protein
MKPEKDGKIALIPTKVNAFVGDLAAGQFEQQLAHALSCVAAGVVGYGKVGSVTVKFDLKRIGDDSRQVNIGHEIKMAQPTMRGKKVEEIAMTTQMYVNQGGNMSIFPDTQGDFFKTTGELPLTTK